MKKTAKNKDACVVSCGGAEAWVYNETVKDHFFKPRNLLLDESGYKFDGEGQVGSMACGDVMKVWVKINKKTGRISGCKWRTFGCASAIASTSMMSVMATENGGMEIGRALKLKPEEIIDRLGGLPDRKYHCSVLGQEALRAAIENYLAKCVSVAAATATASRSREGRGA